ncbi:selenoprotein F [Episyrphus balteatus]|uniref:selenoprotein F n=1 Tax=Episyrphus balteatus TaxID=286459 RepID=UPI0024863BBB|nr:selenoprotein F [Episyrphus balteatus]
MAKQFIFLAFIAITSFCASNAEFTTQDCRELGYIKSQLMCSSCDKLDEFGLESLKPHCSECCQEDKTSSTEKRYPKAILEVCTCKFRAYPQIQAFLQSERPRKFPNLEIKYVRGLDPIIKLLDNNRKVKETLSITKWNTDTLEEFFETHLEKNPAKSEYSNYL